MRVAPAWSNANIRVHVRHGWKATPLSHIHQHTDSYVSCPPSICKKSNLRVIFSACKKAGKSYTSLNYIKKIYIYTHIYNENGKDPQNPPFNPNSESFARVLIKERRGHSAVSRLVSVAVLVPAILSSNPSHKGVPRNLKDLANQEIKTKHFYLQPFLLGWQIGKLPTSCFCDGMKRSIKPQEKLGCHEVWNLPTPIFLLTRELPSLGRSFPRQQHRNPAREVDAGKAHTGSQQPLTNTRKRDLLFQSRKLVWSPFFIWVLEPWKPSALLPLAGFRLPTLCRCPFPITPESSFLAPVPARSRDTSETWTRSLVITTSHLSFQSCLPNSTTSSQVISHWHHCPSSLLDRLPLYPACFLFSPATVHFPWNTTHIWSLS